MSTPSVDSAFAGSIPAIYEKHLVPLIFEFFADDLARRLAVRPVTRVLEVAAGTGVVTRRLATVLPVSSEIVATDLNPAMVEQASRSGTARPVSWQQADALELPFDNDSFDAVVCQFGVMFFPDKARGFSELRRVLRPGGRLLFNVWDRIEANEFAATVSAAVEALYATDPPRFLSRTPYNYNDRATIGADLERGGLGTPALMETVTGRSSAASPEVPAIAFCQGCPLRSEIEARGTPTLDDVTRAATDAVARRFGRGAVSARMQALVVEAVR